MKTYMKRLVRDEKGAALVLVLILLLIGGLISAALLGHMGAGLLAGEIYERRTDELYAADAGVEDAIWKIPDLKLCLHQSTNYTIPDVNDKRVEVFIEFLDPGTYKITSVAITDSDGSGGIAAIDSSTTVEAYLSASYLDLSPFLDNAIISDHFIGIKNNVYVSGNVTSGGEVQCWGEGGCEDIVDGTVTENADLDWPEAEDLSTYYLSQVSGAVHYDGDTLLDLDGNSCPPGPIYKTIDKIEEAVYWPDGLGPLKVNGELDVTSSVPHQDVTLKLNDTLYITGDTKIYGPTEAEPSELTIDLNGQTIFVASPTTDGHNALEIDKCNIIGSGCIIAVGDVYVAPKGNVGSKDEFVLIMSVDGTTTVQPSGTFYGCIAGYASVEVKSGGNATIIHTDPEDKGLHFPGMGDDESPVVTGVSIESWEVKQQ
jgi:Flp pilus assembly pilin Flp